MCCEIERSNKIVTCSAIDLGTQDLGTQTAQIRDAIIIAVCLSPDPAAAVSAALCIKRHKKWASYRAMSHYEVVLRTGLSNKKTPQQVLGG